MVVLAGADYTVSHYAATQATQDVRCVIRDHLFMIVRAFL